MKSVFLSIAAAITLTVTGCGASNDKAELPANPAAAPTELPGTLAGPTIGK